MPIESPCWDRQDAPLLPYCIFGLPFHALRLEQVVAVLRRAAGLKSPLFLSTPNVNFLVACQSDQAFRESVLLSDLSAPDGMPIVWMAKLLGLPIEQRVAGANLFEALQAGTVAQASEQMAVYFFGGPDGAAQAACDRVNQAPSAPGALPAMRCVGFASPGFGSIADMSSPAIIDHINASGADFLLVALGARKGQNWILHNRRQLRPPLVSHLGAVVNFVAGTIRRAPPYFQRIGMEWLWRINQEPSLWWRYFKDAVLLFGLLTLRAVPQVALEKILGGARARVDQASFSISEGSTQVAVKLQGVWVSANRFRLWQALQDPAGKALDMEIDLSGLEYLDCAMLGLLLHLRGIKGRQQRELRLVGAGVRIRSIFYFSCVNYLLAAQQAPGSATHG